MMKMLLTVVVNILDVEWKWVQRNSGTLPTCCHNSEREEQKKKIKAQSE